MSEPENKPPTEVLRTKRLEIVDDERKVRAALGTDEAGVTSLSIFDQSGRLRASLDASEIPEQANGLALFDTNGRLQVAMGASAVNVNEGGLKCYDPNGEDRAGLTMHKEGSGLFFNDTKGEPRAGLNVNEKSSNLYCCDANGESRSDFGVYEDGQAGLRLSAAQKDRQIQMAATKDGNLYLVLSEEDTSMAGLTLAEGEDKELSSDLALISKDGRTGVVVSSGRSSDPHLRLTDRRHNVRGFFGLGIGGEPRLYLADEEGRPIGGQSAFDRMVAERGLVYQALLSGALLFIGVIGGAWIAGTVSASFASLPAAVITTLVAVITTLVLTVLVGWLIVGRRSR